MRCPLQFALDKSQQVLLIHACRMMNVRIHLTNIVKITMRHSLALCDFLMLVEQLV